MPELCNQQLIEENRILKSKLTLLEASNGQFKGHEAIYRALFEHAGYSIVVFKEEIKEAILYNNCAYEMLGYTENEFKNMDLSQIDIRNNSHDKKMNRKTIAEQGSVVFKTMHKKKNGEVLHMLISSVVVYVNGNCFHQNIGSDITELVLMENRLKQSHYDLEERVIEKTELLNCKNMELLESNSALKILLQNQNESMREVGDRLMDNVNMLITPYIKTLKKSRLNERQLVNLIELEINLKNILSPFLGTLSKQYHSLTPMEIKIAALIRDGKKTKEITDILGIAIKTVETHRTNLRKKMGLQQSKINLQSHLRTLENTQ